MHTPTTPPSPRRPRRKTVVIVAGAVLGMAAIGGIMDAVSGDGDDNAAASTTPTPGRTASARPPATPQQKLADAIGKELGRGNRDEVKRLGDVALDGEMLTVRWAINSQFSEGLTNKGARRDIVAIIKAIKAAGVPVDRAHLHGTYSMRNTSGEVSEDTVIRVLYTGATIDRIVPDKVDRDRVTELAEPGAFIAPAFRL